MTVDFLNGDLRLRLWIVDWRASISNQQSAISIVNQQSKNRQSPFRNPQ